MSILKSLAFGSPGEYNLFGMTYSFKEGEKKAPIAGRGVSSVISRLWQNQLFRVATLGYLQTAVHETGHALARSLFYNEHEYSEVNVYTTRLSGDCPHVYRTSLPMYPDRADYPDSEIWSEACMKFDVELEEVRALALQKHLPWKDSVLYAAGPMTSIAFSGCKLVAAAALKNTAFWPVALVLGIGSIAEMECELRYAIGSAGGTDDRGDFGLIARKGNTHLAIASAALVAECALGAFAAIKML